MAELLVSVPIRGLFNLTIQDRKYVATVDTEKFPSPSGDYLI